MFVAHLVLIVLPHDGCILLGQVFRQVTLLLGVVSRLQQQFLLFLQIADVQHVVSGFQRWLHNSTRQPYLFLVRAQTEVSPFPDDLGPLLPGLPGDVAGNVLDLGEVVIDAELFQVGTDGTVLVQLV